MELRLYLLILRRWWWLVAIPALVVGAVGLATYHRPPTTYGATVRFNASLPPALGSSGFDPTYYSWLTSEYIVGGLSDWIKTSAFAQAVSDELARQGKTLGATFASDYVRSQLVLFVNGGDADSVKAAAAAAIVVLQTRNADAFPQLGGANAAVTVLDTPTAGASSPGLRSLIDLPIRLGLGLAAGLALAFLAHFLDPFLRHKQEVEAMGLKVLGEIPKSRKQ